MERKVIIIMGATASGKTSLALNLAPLLSTEIISADSRQIYKYLNIGTAKPSEQELNLIKHHLVDCLDLDEVYNAYRFEKESISIIKALHSSGKIPIVVGGTGLYIKALINGIFADDTSNETLRAEIESKRILQGNESIYKDLVKVDPIAAGSMLPQNYKRVIRALEVFYLTNRSIIDLQANYKRFLDFDFRLFYLQWERNSLYERINTRTDLMLKSGLLEEVSSIIAMGYSPSLNSLNTVGYKEIIDYLSGRVSLSKALDLIKRNSRHYAKRQETWFRKMEVSSCFSIKSESDLKSLVDKIFKEII